jgi:signal transduction histidine kinase
MLTLTVAPDHSANAAGISMPQQVGTIIHDLRQPLSVIEMCADYLILILPSDQEQARRQIAMMQQQVGQASRILCDALRLLDADQRPAAQASRCLTKPDSAGLTY